jgi:uncharacterized protein
MRGKTPRYARDLDKTLTKPEASLEDKINTIKHDVDFEEAKTVFGDPLARVSEDNEHSEYERRWHIIGFSKYTRLLVVAFAERNEKIRIITSRKATSSERKKYEKYRFKT